MFTVLPNFLLFFFNDTATTEIYTLSLHDALPICSTRSAKSSARKSSAKKSTTSILKKSTVAPRDGNRSEEHTSELQSRLHLVCRLLLEKKKQMIRKPTRQRVKTETTHA